MITTQLEGAIPGLCDAAGYDKPVSIVFSNSGAPRFIFKHDDLSIKFDLMVSLYDREFTQKYVDITMKGLLIKFKVRLDQDMNVFTDWENIQMDSAEVKPYVKLNDKLDNVVVVSYFNWVFEELLPWVNENHPEAVSHFHLPSTFPGVMDLKNLKLEVRDSFLFFSMDPEFLVLETPKVEATLI